MTAVHVRNQSPAPVRGAAADAVAAPATTNQTTVQNLSQTPLPLNASNTGSVNQDIMDKYNKDILEHLQTQFDNLAVDAGASATAQTLATPVTGASSNDVVFPKHLAGLVAQTVSQTIMQIQPIIMSTMSIACSKMLVTMMDMMKNTPPPATAQPLTTANNNLLHQDLRKQMRQSEYASDQRDQDARSCTIRIKGVEVTEGEDLIQEVIKVAGQATVTFQPADVIEVYRSGNSNTDPEKRAIVAKLSHKGKKIALMRNKKKITGGRIFIEESLTKLRGKLFFAVRKDDNTLKSWTQEGKIYTKIKGTNNEEVLKIITTPDDLTKIGWDEDRISTFWDTFKNE